jgi:hypothetical protein
VKKIPSVFKRNYDTDNLIRDDVVDGCEWVAYGEGVATRKWDGTACLIRDGRLFKRYDAKGKTPPPNWEPCEPAGDPKTGHWPGWVPVGEGPEDWLYRACKLDGLTDGTYELVGPKVNGNPDGFDEHRLVRHGEPVIPDVPRDFDAMRVWFAQNAIEGVVFHHPDGRMAKVKRRDFGLPWPPNQPEAKGEVERKAVIEWLRRRRQKAQPSDTGIGELENAIAAIASGDHILLMRAEREKTRR